jgi:cell wall-associated NlpC family hydrolase
MSNALAEVFTQYAERFIGTPYRWAGDDPMAGFDCSGLVVECLQAVGRLNYGIDATAQVLHDALKAYAAAESFGRGDLVFFGKTNTSITHVGIICSGYIWHLSGHLMIEAGGGGSKTLTVEDAIKQNAYVRVRPTTWGSRVPFGFGRWW